MRFLAHLFAILAAAMLAAQPIAAQSILRDAETEAFLDEISAPLVEAAGLEPENVDIVLINDPSINAFVAGGQIVYIHSGLIDAADTAEEVQGVIAHELGHITGGHILRYGEGMASASRISLLSLIAGIGRARRCGQADGDHGRRAAGRHGQVPRLQPHAGILRRFRGCRIPVQGGHFRARVAALRTAQRISLWLQPERRGRLLSHSPAVGRSHLLREVYEKDPAGRPANANCSSAWKAAGGISSAWPRCATIRKATA